MINTSHFVGLELNPVLFSDLFVKLYEYLEENNVKNILVFQNLLSLHITLYYFEKDISVLLQDNIKGSFNRLNLENNIFINGFQYFHSIEGKKKILYLTPSTLLPLEQYRDLFHEKFNRIEIEENNLKFFPHITIFKINDSSVFEIHRGNIENIILQELSKIKNIDIFNGKINLYAVNSNFKEEIQVQV